MNHVLRIPLIFALALLLFAAHLGRGAAPAGAQGTTEEGEDFSERPPPPEPPDPIFTLLPTLKVTADSCYAFLRPSERSLYFGPLRKGEKVKRLDHQGKWIHVWIPRLREAGWVRREKVTQTAVPLVGKGRVPEDLLPRVRVMVKWANIREGPTTQTKILTVAKRDQGFLLLDQKEGWYQIWLPDLQRHGWISGRIAKKQLKDRPAR